MWRFLFTKLFQKEIMTLNDNFNKLADEYDKLRQQFNQMEMRIEQYTYPHHKEIEDIKHDIHRLTLKLSKKSAMK